MENEFTIQLKQKREDQSDKSEKIQIESQVPNSENLKIWKPTNYSHEEMNKNENDYYYERLFGQWQNDCETQIKKKNLYSVYFIVREVEKIILQTFMCGMRERKKKLESKWKIKCEKKKKNQFADCFNLECQWQ